MGKETRMEVTTAQIRSVNAEIWRRFQAECILRQVKTAVALQQAIETWLKTKPNQK